MVAILATQQKERDHQPTFKLVKTAAKEAVAVAKVSSMNTAPYKLPHICLHRASLCTIILLSDRSPQYVYWIKNNLAVCNDLVMITQMQASTLLFQCTIVVFDMKQNYPVEIHALHT